MTEKEDSLDNKTRTIPGSGTEDHLVSEIRQPTAVYDQGYSTTSKLQGSPAHFSEGFRPKTPLGARLLEIRRAIESSDTPLLSLGEIEQEIEARRGGAHLLSSE